MTNLIYHPLAKRELEEAVDYYLVRSIRKAAEFNSIIKNVMEQIEMQPDFYGWYDDDFRQAILRKYPYVVIYRQLDALRIQVIAVAHTSREPGYWKDRVS